MHMNFTLHFSGYEETTTVSSVTGSKRSVLGTSGNQSEAGRQTLASTLNTIRTEDGSDKDGRLEAARREVGTPSSLFRCRSGQTPICGGVS
jgi:hypothetical protein